MKLYNMNGKFMESVPEPSRRFEGVKHYNELGLYIKAQFNKSMTKVVRSYAGVRMVQPSEVIADHAKRLESPL